MKNQSVVESFTDMAAMQFLLEQPLIRLYVGSTAGYGETQATLNVYQFIVC